MKAEGDDVGLAGAVKVTWAVAARWWVAVSSSASMT